MGNTNPDKTGPMPAQSDETELPPEGQMTEALPELIVLTDGEGATPTGAEPTEASLAAEGKGDDDVYVILPEGDTSEIPVVETQALDEAAETGDLEATETVPLPGDSDSGAGDGTEQILHDTAPETQNLEQMTEEITDHILVEESTGSFAAAAGAKAAIEAEGAEDVSAEVEEPVRAPASTSWIKIVSAAAALLCVAAAGFWYLGGFGSTSSPVIATTGAGQVAPGQGTTPTDPNPGVTTTPASSGTDPEAILVAASKDALRGKLRAALELGFGG